MNGELSLTRIENKEEFFGPLWEYLKNPKVTDVNWNGRVLWIDDFEYGRYATETQLSEAFINSFTTRVSNLVNCPFNTFAPNLEAETDTLRISIIHESISHTGRSISIRVTPPNRRIDNEKMFADNYCTEEWDRFVRAMIDAHLNFSIAGLPGAGKTEYLKTLTAYIPDWERTITIEDNLEIHYSSINPDSDSIEIKVGDHMSYSEAIKASLRQNPKWLMLSETRGIEVNDLMKAWSTGINGMTTIHTDSVLKIPDRMLNMSGQYSEPMRNNIYSFLDVGILVASIRDKETQRFKRRIAEAAFFSRINEHNDAIVFYKNGKFLTDKIPADIMHKFELYEVENPLTTFKIEKEAQLTVHGFNTEEWK